MRGNMDLTKAQQIVTTSGEAEVNKHLDAGWSLIAVATGQDEQKYPLTLYTLAWLGEDQPGKVSPFQSMHG